MRLEREKAMREKRKQRLQKQKEQKAKKKKKYLPSFEPFQEEDALLEARRARFGLKRPRETTEAVEEPAEKRQKTTEAATTES